jgi:hypothetical protein
MSVQLRTNAQDLALKHATPVAPVPTGGIARGARVMTARGPIPVEVLEPGERIVTRERGMVRLRSVTPYRGRSCMIGEGGVGLARPERLGGAVQGRQIVLHDWRTPVHHGSTVTAARAYDGPILARIGHQDLFRLDLGAPLTIFVDGMEVSTGRTALRLVDGA